MKKIFLILIILCLAFKGYTQNRILLNNTESKKEVFFNQGANVSYLIKNSFKVKYGILTNISDSAFEINGLRLSANNLNRFGENNKSKKTWGYVLCSFSGLILGTMVLSSNSSSTKLIGGIGAGVSFVLGEVLLDGSLPKNLEKRWRLSIIKE